MAELAEVEEPRVHPKERLEELFAEVAEVCGQRNALDGRLVELVAEIDHGGTDGAALWGNTGCRSLSHLVAWKTGCSPGHAQLITAIVERLDAFPQCVTGLREGRLSVDQVGVIAQRAGNGSDEHYAELAAVATVSQLRTALKMEVRPDPEPSADPEDDAPPPPRPEPRRSISQTSDDRGTHWRITLPDDEAAVFEAALQSHRDALIHQWRRDHDAQDPDDIRDAHGRKQTHRDMRIPPMPSTSDAFMALVEAGWDADVARRPHGQRTQVVMHFDMAARIAALHVGPVLSDDDRRYLTCDATCEAWFERDGQVIGSGRETRTINRRLRRALEHRDRCCVVPGCGATTALHAHHLIHWEDGGPTELWNLALVCPYHHRMHHRGELIITGPAHRLRVTDSDGEPLHGGSLARPPTTPPPDVAPYPGPLGERANWWWYTPYEPKPPPNPN